MRAVTIGLAGAVLWAGALVVAGCSGEGVDGAAASSAGGAAGEASAGGAVDASAGDSALLEADRAFDAAVAEGGSEAWASWFAEDGALVRQGVGEIRGRAAVREAVAFLDDSATSLRWAPERADVAASGDLGWTTGRYAFRSVDSTGAPVRGEGVYVSIWRRQADGTWKVVMDLGNPTGPGAP